MTVIVNPDPNNTNNTGTTTGTDTSNETDDSLDLENEDTASIYQDYMRYPILFANAVDNDETNGKAVLSDSRTCTVTDTYNQIPTLQMTYPRDGIASKLIKPEMIIMTDINRIITHQKFRIKQVLRDGDQLQINGTHIIGDLAGVTLSGNIQMPNVTVTSYGEQLLDKATDTIPDVTFDSDDPDVRNIDIDFTQGEYISNYIFDADQEGDTPTQSIIGLFGGEILLDNYHIMHRKHAGRDTGIVIKYGDRINTIQQDENIENTYTAIFPFAKYQPGQAIATKDNTDWSQWEQDWTSVGTVQYNAGGSVTIYDSPVDGNAPIGTLEVGASLQVGKPVANGSFTPDGKFQINTVNGDTWYPVNSSAGMGWVDSQWITFDKSGDYLVNDAVGHIHTAISEDDSKNTHYPMKGTGTVNWLGSSKQIRVFYSPDPGVGHNPTGKVLKYGQRFHYDEVAVDENGDKWYRLALHEWVYGPHVKVDSSQDITRYPAKGKGVVKKGAQAYHIDSHGMMVEKTHKGKLVSTRKHKTPIYKTVYRGKGKNRHKVKEKTYTYGKPIKYHETEKTKLKKSTAKIIGQVTVGNTIYYKLSDNTYVKSSGIDWTNKISKKPTLPKKLIAENASKKGYIELYSAPTKGKSLNVTIPVNTSLDVKHSAQGGDGNTWYEVTYTDPKGKTTTGWIPASNADTSAPEDLEPTAPDDSDDNPNVKDDTVDQSEVLVTLGDGEDGLVFPDSPGYHEVNRIQNVDLSSYIKHDDQDLSGQQPDGSFVATDDDKAQLLQAAQEYVIEHQIGIPQVSLTVDYAQSSDVEGDLTTLNLYDMATVYFKQQEINVKAQVTSTVYDALAHHYQTVTIGDLPKTWQHLLVEQANKNTDQLEQKFADSKEHTGHLFQDIHAALAKEGQARHDAEVDIAKQIGLVNDKTQDLDISYKQLDTQMTTIDSNVTQMRYDIENGGTQELRFVDASGFTNFLHPTEIRAVNDDGSYLRFNSEGLGYFDSTNGQIRSAITADGQIAAESISAGVIHSLKIDTGEIEGALKVGYPDDPIRISIGTQQPPDNPLKPTYGGNGIWLDSSDYHSLVSSGRFVTIDTSQKDTWEYGTNGPKHNGDSLYSIVKGYVSDWIHQTVTVGGKKYDIWK